MTRRAVSARVLTSHAAVCLAFAAGLLLPTNARAQADEAKVAPPAGAHEAAPLPAMSFAFPDLPSDFADKTTLRWKGFILRTDLALIVDYNAFAQDAASLSQVGEQQNQWEARAARLMLNGKVGHYVTYLAAAEYKGFETDPETTWQITDLSITVPLGGPATKLTVGKTKETFAYEMVGDAANLPQQERVLNPFFVTRNVGAKVTHVFGRLHRMTASAGVFNDWFATGDRLADIGTDVTARVTGLLWDQDSGRRFLHLGVAGRYYGADGNTLRYKGRPESNVTDYYVDTANLAGDHAWHVGLEALWNHGPYSVLSEYVHASVASAASGNPGFWGAYVTGSWVLTGETRAYDRTVGYARRVQPAGRWGALELVARFSHVGLDDGVVRGGTFDKTYVAMNWWATRRWKLGAGWGHTWLDRFGTTGVTDSLQLRWQWVY
ncbi:MAG: OprO/OprP family phosphate-selective porin [Rhodospirillaceae bacterium]